MILGTSTVSQRAMISGSCCSVNSRLSRLDGCGWMVKAAQPASIGMLGMSILAISSVRGRGAASARYCRSVSAIGVCVVRCGSVMVSWMMWLWVATLSSGCRSRSRLSRSCGEHAESVIIKSRSVVSFFIFFT